MDQLGPYRGGEKGRRWFGAIGNGVVVCLLLGSMLAVAFKFAFPETVEERPVLRNLCGIGIWVMSIAVGAWQVVRHRPRP